jgi:hypothetical protein
MNPMKHFSFFFLLFSLGLQAQTRWQPSQLIKWSSANENYRNTYFKAAYDGYIDLLSEIKDKPEIYLAAGKSAYQIRLFSEASFLFSRARQVSTKPLPELDLWEGKTWFGEGQLDSAIALLNRAQPQLKGEDQDDAKLWLSYAKNARREKAKPQAVGIRPIDVLNTDGVESSVFLSLDENTLFFTSARQENTGKDMDEENGIYFQDIWTSRRDSLSKTWTEPQPLPGNVNTPQHDACLGLSPQGDMLFVYKSEKGGDIFYSRCDKKGNWREPKPMGGDINTSYFESSACLSADAKTMYLISEREKRGAKGNGDIWMLKKEKRTEYGNATNLGTPVNTLYDENSVSIHPDGKTLFFSSNRPESMGGYDIFVTRREGNSWLPPQNLGYPINTEGDEVYFSLSVDGNTGWVSSRRKESLGESYDIYEIDLSNYVLPLDRNSAAKRPTVCLLQGKILDKSNAMAIETELRLTDANGKLIQTIETAENGEFRVSIPGDQSFTLQAAPKGYQPQSEPVLIKSVAGKTQSLTKVFLMAPQP